MANRRELSRRDFMRLSALAAAGAMAAACAPAAPQAPAPEAAPPAEEKPAEQPAAPAGGGTKVQLYTLVWQEGAVAATQKAVEDWNAANKARIEIEYIQGSWGNARDYLTTSIAGGVVPEVIHGITMWANEYGTQGSYLDLSEMIANSDLATDLHPAALAAATSPLDDKIYGLPWCWEVGMMYVNADRITAAGFEVPSKGWSWEDFITIAKAVSKPPDYYGFAANLSATQTTEDIIAWMWQTGAEVMGEIDGVWKIDMEPAREALQLWYDMLWTYEIISPDSFGGTNIFEAFPLGVYSMMQTGNWARGLIKSAEPEFTWHIVPLPCHKRCANSSEPQTWSLATQSRERGTTEAAWEVLQWMSNKENSAAIAFGDWLFPTRQSAMADPRFTTSTDDWDVTLSQVEFGKAYPKHPAWAEFDERVLGPNIQKYLQKELSLDELLNLCNEEGTKLLGQYKVG